MGLDLGNIFGTLVGAYSDITKAKVQASSQYNRPSYVSGFEQPTNPALVTPAVGLPFVDIVPDEPTGECRVMNWNPRLGKWVPARRRRKRRLASTSDIKDIAALKAVLGPSQLKTWIATHG